MKMARYFSEGTEATNGQDAPVRNVVPLFIPRASDHV